MMKDLTTQQDEKNAPVKNESSYARSDEDQAPPQTRTNAAETRFWAGRISLVVAYVCAKIAKLVQLLLPKAYLKTNLGGG